MLFLIKKNIVLTCIVLAVLFLVVVVLWRLYVGCNVWEASCVFPNPQIQITADVVRGVAPLKVEFTVTANGMPIGHPLYNCPGERFENGVTIIEGFPHCTKRGGGVFENSTQTKTYHYTYKEPGVYTAQYHLVTGDAVRSSSNVLAITVKN